MRVWLIVALLVSPAVYADGVAPYIGGGYVQTYYKESGFSTAKPSAGVFRVGAVVNPYLAVEGRVGTGISSSTITASGLPVTLKINSFYGAYVRGMLPLGQATPYLLAGYTRGRLTASGGGVSVSGSDSSASYGIGIDVPVAQQVSLNAEYSRLLKGSGYTLDALMVGALVRF